MNVDRQCNKRSIKIVNQRCAAVREDGGVIHVEEEDFGERDSFRTGIFTYCTLFWTRRPSFSNNRHGLLLEDGGKRKENLKDRCRVNYRYLLYSNV